MIQEFALDLRAARRNSGLRQVDCAHLMGVSKNKISSLECGLSRPTVHDICTLSMIYGRSFESLFSGIFSEVRQELAERLLDVPDVGPRHKRRHNRNKTFQNLRERLEAPFPDNHDV